MQIMSHQLLEDVLVEISAQASMSSAEVDLHQQGDGGALPAGVPLRSDHHTDLWASRAVALGRSKAANCRLRRRMLVSCPDEIAVGFDVIELSETEQLILELSGQLAANPRARQTTHHDQ